MPSLISCCLPQLLLVPLLLLLPSTQATEEPAAPACTNTSSWGPMVWQDSEEACCLSTVVEPYCDVYPVQVCANLTETKCQTVAYQECSMSPCPVSLHIPTHQTEHYEEWVCKDIWVNVTHVKKRPKEVTKSKQECDDIWLTLDDGTMVSGGKENCKTVYWKDYEFERYNVSVPTKKSNCTKLPPFEFLSCSNSTTVSQQMCTECEARAGPRCETTERIECVTGWVKKCEPRTETDCTWRYKEPVQEFTHKKRCTGHTPQEEDKDEDTTGRTPQEEDKDEDEDTTGRTPQEEDTTGCTPQEEDTTGHTPLDEDELIPQ